MTHKESHQYYDCVAAATVWMRDDQSLVNINHIYAEERTKIMGFHMCLTLP